MTDGSPPETAVPDDRAALADLAESQCKYVTRPFSFAARLREFGATPDDLHRELLAHTPFRPASLRGSMQFAAHATHAAAASDVNTSVEDDPLAEAVPARFDWPEEQRDRLAQMADHGDHALANGDSDLDHALDQLPAMCRRAADALREAPDEYAARLAERGLTREVDPEPGELQPLLAAVGLVTAGTVLLLREDPLGGRCTAAGLLAWPDRDLQFDALEPPAIDESSGQARLTEF